MKRRVFILGASIVVLLIVFGGSFWNWYLARKAGPEALGRVPEFNLPAATSKGPTMVGSQDLRGRPWVANFIFTHCSGPCPLMSSKMADLQKVLPAGVQLVTFTVDPDRDDLNVLAEYARHFEADPARWFFVRADKPTLYKLVFEGFKLPMMEDPSAESGFRVTHSTKFVFVDGQGRIRRYFESSDENMNASMSEVANALLKETS